MWKSTLVLTVLAAVLSGCAGMNFVESDVAAYSQWPQERKPLTYVFERLPSQQARPQVQEQLEESARPALKAAGFSETTDTQTANVTAQLNARVLRVEYSPYSHPIAWHGGMHFGRFGLGGIWGSPMYDPVYDSHSLREVSILIRDRQTGRTLYEAHANNEGNTVGNDPVTRAMFEAALKDFPYSGVNPRRVRIALAR